MPKKGYRQTPEHRAKIAAMRRRPGAAGEGLKTNQRHGKIDSGAYRSWRAMRQRCSTGGKYEKLGVAVCDRWATSFENFYADMGDRPEGMTLDRINPFGHYEPDNCRWATADQQAVNTRRNRSESGNQPPGLDN